MTTSMTNTNLSDNAVSFLFYLDPKAKKIFPVNKTLQVIEVESEGLPQIKCKLSDGKFFSEDFTVAKKKDYIKLFDIIVVDYITVTLGSGGQRYFFLVKFSVTSNAGKVLGSPVKYVHIEEEEEVKNEAKDNKHVTFKFQGVSSNDTNKDGNGSIRSRLLEKKLFNEANEVVSKEIVNPKNTAVVKTQRISLSNNSLKTANMINIAPVSSVLVPILPENNNNKNNNVISVSSSPNPFLDNDKKSKKEIPSHSSVLKVQEDKKNNIPSVSSVSVPVPDNNDKSKKNIPSGSTSFSDLQNSNFFEPQNFAVKIRLIKYFIEERRHMQIGITDKNGMNALLIIPDFHIKKFASNLKLCQVYLLQNGDVQTLSYSSNESLNLSNNSAENNDSEKLLIITINDQTEISECFDFIPLNYFIEENNFFKLSNLPLSININFKLLVLVCKVNPKENILTKDSLNLPVKRLTIVDDSYHQCHFDLLRQSADFNIKEGDILYIHMPVKTFSEGGIKLETGARTKVEINPFCKQITEMRKRLHNCIGNYISLSSEISDEFTRINLKQMRDLIALRKKNNFNSLYEIKLTVKHLKRSLKNVTKGCLDQTCQGKFRKTDINFCLKCNKKYEVFEMKSYLKLNLTVADVTGQEDIFLLHDVSERLLFSLKRFITPSDYKTALVNRDIKHNEDLLNFLEEPFSFMEIILRGKINWNFYNPAHSPKKYFFHVTDFVPISRMSLEGENATKG